MQPENPVTFTVGSTGRTFLVCHTECMRSCDSFKAPAFSRASTSSFGNPRLAIPWLWRKPHERGGSGTAATTNFAGPTVGTRQRVPVCGGKFCGQFDCRWRQPSCTRKDFSFLPFGGSRWKGRKKVEAIPLGRSYELDHQLWFQLTLVAGQVNVDVMWSRNEVLVSALLAPCFT